MVEAESVTVDVNSPSNGLIKDPTQLSASEPLKSLQKEPKLEAEKNLQQNMHQMNYMNQQMQQAGQRMQGGRHITGAESDDEEE